MASTYSSNLKIELMATGSDSGTWGTNTNTNLGTAIEQAIIGYGNPDYTSDANLTITITNSSASQAARCLVLNVTSVFGSLTATRELIVPTIQKQYIVQNNTTGGQSITVKTSAGTGITVPTGRKAHLYVDGTNVIQMFDFVDINGGTIDGATVGAASASTGAFTTLNASGATTLDGTVALGNAAGDLITVPGTVNSNLIFTDNLFDIGATGATRPRNLFLAGAATVAGNLSVGGTLTLTGGVNLNGNVTVGDSSADTLTINSTITSNLIFTDNTYDIGASGATRPRNLFLAGNITAAGNQTLTGALTVDSTTDSTSTTTGSIQTDGGVGIAKALFVGTTANIAGATTLSSTLTLGGTVAGGGNQINNVIIGASTPLAGSFTTLTIKTTANTGLIFNDTISDKWQIVNRDDASDVLQLVSGNTNSGGTAVVNFVSTNVEIIPGALIQGLTVGRGAGGVSTNTAVGASALVNNSTGSQNTAVGYQTGLSITTGDKNTAFGASIMDQSAGVTGQENSAFGRVSMRFLTSGSYNTALGNESLLKVTSGSNNTAVGYDALLENTTASNNTAVGYQAGYAATAGTSTFLGTLAGYTATSGSSNIFIGYNSLPSAVGDTGTLVIGVNATGKGSNTGFIVANGSIYQGNNTALWAVTSDQRIKKNIVNNNTGLDIINQIQVRNFEYRLPEEVDAELAPTDAIKKSGVQLGVIAQELQQILPECVKTESTGVMSVDADNLTWYLVNAVKELTARIQQLESKP